MPVWYGIKLLMHTCEFSNRSVKLSYATSKILQSRSYWKIEKRRINKRNWTLYFIQNNAT